MNATEAYNLIRKKDETYKATVCREYMSFFVFPIGGVNVFVVDKDSKKIRVTEIYDIPHTGWKSAVIQGG